MSRFQSFAVTFFAYSMALSLACGVATAASVVVLALTNQQATAAGLTGFVVLALVVWPFSRLARFMDRGLRPPT
jgi:hypothetical protein